MNNFNYWLDYWTHMLDESMDKNSINEARMTAQQREQFDAQLRQGIVEFNYYKKEKGPDGRPTGNLIRRHARGTLNPALIPSEQEQRRIASANNIDYDYTMQQRELKQSYMVPYWDLDAAQGNGWGWRQFHNSRFINVERSTPYSGNGGRTTSRGNGTFVHTNRVEPYQIDQRLTTTINSTLRSIGSTISQANSGDGSIVLTFQVQNNIPTLIYNFDIVTSQANIDQFRLTIEDVVRQIFEQHGVLIEKIKADIDITWN